MPTGRSKTRRQRPPKDREYKTDRLDGLEPQILEIIDQGGAGEELILSDEHDAPST